MYVPSTIVVISSIEQIPEPTAHSTMWPMLTSTGGGVDVRKWGCMYWSRVVMLKTFSHLTPPLAAKIPKDVTSCKSMNGNAVLAMMEDFIFLVVWELVWLMIYDALSVATKISSSARGGTGMMLCFFPLEE
jgi:hypothetical protein